VEELSRGELLALVAEQAGAIAAQAQEVAMLRAQNTALVQRVAELERVISRNSGNSSMPPSTDALPGRRPPVEGRRGRDGGKPKRRRGKQRGAAGAGMSWAVPEEIVDHFPVGACGCGADLARARDLGVARSYQQLEVPLTVARRVQHDLHEVRCGCGRVQGAQRPAGVADCAVSIGANLRALVVYLVVFQHVPIQRCQQLIADVTGAAVSVGFVHSCLRKAAGAIAGVLALIKERITAAPVAGFDETTLRCGPKGVKKYVLSASTERYVALHLGRRNLDSFAEFGILPRFAGIVVSDRYPNYFHPRWTQLGGHQACLAHLIRDFQDAAEHYPEAIWPEQAQRALGGLIGAWHEARDAALPQIPTPARQDLLAEFSAAITVGLSQVPRNPGPRNQTPQPVGRELLEFCREHQQYVTGFCFDTRIWPTNNISERDIRPLKTQQKISGRLRCEVVTQHRLDIRGYLDTARKHGQNVMTVLRSVMTGTPWSPPIPVPG
jgi:transposase